MQDKLHVNVKLSLTGLYSRNDLYREKCDGKYVYFNNRLPYRKQQLLNYETAGDPITGLKWTKTTTRKISDMLAKDNIHVSSNTIGKFLKDMGYSLKINYKKIESDPKKATSDLIFEQAL